MAQPQTLKPGNLIVEIGDGGSPEVFSAPCGFTQKSFQRNKSLGEVVIPDCDLPDAPAWVARDVQSTSWSITGEGILAGAAVAVWDTFFASDTSRNVRITESWAAPVGTITYIGKMHIESLEIGASRGGGAATINVSMQSDGAYTRSPALS